MKPTDDLEAFLTKHGSRPVTYRQLASIVKAMGATFKEHSQELHGTIDLLRARVASLEAGPSVKYAGIWDASKTYEPHTFVTFGGSLWAALTRTAGQRPNGGTGAWQLAVKRGSDGKDGRD